MKRQNSQLSSTSRRDNSPESFRAKTIGCMSGIIHLLSKYQNRHKKSLTFGKSKQEKDIIVVSSPSEQISASPPSQGQRKSRNINEETDLRRFSRDFPTRSPTLSAEIRRSNSVNSPPNSAKSPALVARLMGLEAIPAAETSSEKRRKLLGALKKCDNDLNALKEMIIAFRSTEIKQFAGNCFVNPDKVGLVSGGKCRDYNCGEQQRSAVPVLNEFSRLRLNRINSTSKGRENGEEEESHEQVIKKAEVEDKDISFNLAIVERRKLQRSEAKAIVEKRDQPLPLPLPLPLMWRSKAMVDSLNEISSKISWGYSREMGRIGMVLQHHIYIDLIEEMITDFWGLSACFPTNSYLPFEACRRRLRF